MDRVIIDALLKAIELKDGSTAAHSWRVVLYTRLLASRFEVGDEVLRRLTVAAALHDLGKVDIPDGVLLKPGKLTDAEFEIIKLHPVRGHERLVSMGEQDELILQVVRSHHERLDGLGYPDGLRGEAIPPAARYFSVIDTFDALTSARPYRHDLGPDAAERAFEELHRGVGTRYCPQCVEAFERLHREGELAWIMEYYADRAELPSFGEAQDALRATHSMWPRAE